MREDNANTFMVRGGLRGAMLLTEETAAFLGVQGLYKDDDENRSEKGDDGSTRSSGLSCTSHRPSLRLRP
jgi:hypothetical protein